MPVNASGLRRYLVAVFLQGFAILLALVQSLGGVRTDEAKYLLNIPYPHPPLLRFVIGWTEAFPLQELFLRFILATLLVQAVWLVADLGRNFTSEKRLTLCIFWLTAGSLLLQAGTVMMAPVTALQGLVFVWLFFNDAQHMRGGATHLHQSHMRANGTHAQTNHSRDGWIALLWLVSLFSAYQAILYVPIVWSVFRRNGLSFMKTAIVSGVPIALIVLYIAGNPLAISSFINVGGQNAAASYEAISGSIIGAWLIAGSGVLSVLGTYGAMRLGRKELFLSILLLLAFLLISFRAYYAILFLPLFIAGVVAYPLVLLRPHFVAAAQILCAVVLLVQTPLPLGASPARRIMGRINDLPGSGVVLINGSFGHEWQYESRIPILRYRSALLSRAKAVVCLDSCPEIARYEFYQIENVGEEVWVRK